MRAPSLPLFLFVSLLLSLLSIELSAPKKLFNNIETFAWRLLPVI